MATAAAIAGAAVIGASSASSQAKAAARGQKAAQAAIASGQHGARRDLLKIFPQAQASLLLGGQNALDVFQRAAPLQQQQLSQGNLSAQRSIASGFDQARNALLGGPIGQFDVRGVPVDTRPLFGGINILDQAGNTLGGTVTADSLKNRRAGGRSARFRTRG